MNKPLSNEPPRKKHKLRKLIFWVVGVFIVYTLVGFFVLPPIVRSVAAKKLSEQLGREVTIKEVKLNPFAFSGTIRGVLIKEKNGDPFLSWDEAYGNFQATSLFGHTWVFKELRTSQPFVHVQMNSDGTFNFSDILAKFSTNAAPKKAPSGPTKQLALRIDQLEVSGATLSLKRDVPVVTAGAVAVAEPKPVAATNTTDAILLLLQSVTNGVAQFSKITNSLAASIGTLSLSNCTVRLEDLANARPARLTIDQIFVNSTNLSNLPLTNMTTAVSLRWNTNGTLHTEVDASLSPPSVDIHLAFANIELHPLDPYLDSRLSVFIIGSKLGMDGKIRFRSPAGALPEVTFTGDTWLNDFNTVDGVLGEPLLKWNSVHISGIDAALNPPVVGIKQIAVNDAYARLIIETNKTINLLAALRIANPLTNTTAEAEPAKKTESKKADAKSLLAGDRIVSTNALAELPIKKLSVGTIVITNTSANFTDRSISPNVNMSVEQISGTIAGISSEELQHADINLHAKVDNVGPAEITGVINPFSKDQTNEIKIAVNDVDLTGVSSYSGKFAGYRIAKGKLNVALAYHLHGRSLKSENVITLDQFTFGEKVNSPEATHLPVRLGIAILKDRNGKIVLDVPIEGSLDDPQFRLHKVITRALWNIAEKAITSPFAVLGAMFGGGKGEELAYQEFPAGSGELTPATKEKLDVMIKALYERPGLQMEITGSVDTNADIGGLRERFLEKQLRAQKWQTLRKFDQEGITPDKVTITPEERPDLVQKMYADYLAKGLIVTNTAGGTNAVIPPPPTRRANTAAERGASQLMARGQAATPQPAAVASAQAAVTDVYELAILNSISVADEDYQGLASDRAKAVREYILQSGKVEGERLFLTEAKAGSLKTEGPRVYLQLQ
jgi:uncharacterized protein DUF748